MRVFSTLEEIESAAGEEIGTTDWVEIDQDRVDKFADATGDHQWIHVDVERAKDGPFGGTIAHGYLTLSLVPVARQPGLHPRHARPPSSTTASTRCASPTRSWSARGSARTVSIGAVTDIPAGKQLTMRLRRRDRGRGQARLRRRDVVLLLLAERSS